MERFLGPYSDHAYALMRIVVGVFFVVHGAMKIFGVLDGFTPPAFSQLWVGGMIELVGGGLIALGLFAGYAAFVLSGQMALAYFQFHMFGREPSIWPMLNKGELPAVYAFVLLYLATRGAGIWSLEDLKNPGGA